MTTAVVLSGGSSLGAAQVGMLRALFESGVRADLFVGTSVGALNAAWAAAEPTGSAVGMLDTIWCGLARRDVFPSSPVHGVLAMAGRRRGMVPDARLRALLVRHLRFSRLEDAAVPLHVVATDIGTGDDVLFSSGPAVDVLLASAAIPGLLPPVEMDGRWYSDGALVNNTPISHAVALGADTVWVLPAGYPCARPDPPGSPAGMAMQGITVLVQRRMLADATAYRGPGRPPGGGAAVPGRVVARGLLADSGSHRPCLRVDAALVAPRPRSRRSGVSRPSCAPGRVTAARAGTPPRATPRAPGDERSY